MTERVVPTPQGARPDTRHQPFDKQPVSPSLNTCHGTVRHRPVRRSCSYRRQGPSGKPATTFLQKPHRQQFRQARFGTPCAAAAPTEWDGHTHQTPRLLQAAPRAVSPDRITGLYYRPISSAKDRGAILPRRWRPELPTGEPVWPGISCRPALASVHLEAVRHDIALLPCMYGYI